MKLPEPAVELLWNCTVGWERDAALVSADGRKHAVGGAGGIEELRRCRRRCTGGTGRERGMTGIGSIVELDRTADAGVARGGDVGIPGGRRVEEIDLAARPKTTKGPPVASAGGSARRGVVIENEGRAAVGTGHGCAIGDAGGRVVDECVGGTVVDRDRRGAAAGGVFEFR